MSHHKENNIANKSKKHINQRKHLRRLQKHVNLLNELLNTQGKLIREYQNENIQRLIKRNELSFFQLVMRLCVVLLCFTFYAYLLSKV